MNKKLITLAALSFAASACVAQPAQQAAEEEQPPMTFFITSVGLGNGADLGGLEGADAHCQSLGESVGSTKTWRAYLSTQAKNGEPAVNARDRIGDGPWHNINGLDMGTSVDALHYDNANFNYNGVRTEQGNTVNSRGMGNAPNMHDILTGSNMDGTAPTGDDDATCSNWTSSGEGAAIVGHHDRFRFTTPGSSWNSVHPSRGCSQEALEATGGAGLFYCFAID